MTDHIQYQKNEINMKAFQDQLYALQKAINCSMVKMSTDEYRSLYEIQVFMRDFQKRYFNLKETIWDVQFVSSEAFRVALLDINDIDEANVDIDNKTLTAEYSRYMMNSAGFHIGYENVTFAWKLIKRIDIGLYGFPVKLDAYVINPNEYEIKAKDMPLEDELEHMDDCSYIAENINDPELDYDNFNYCDCADNFEGYAPPDDDFFYQQMDMIIGDCLTNLPDAVFNKDEKKWKLGDCEYFV